MNRARAWLLVVVASLSAAGCTTLSPEEDPVQIKINDLDNRLTRIERVVANQSLLQLSNDLEAMRADVKSMRNEVDQLNNAVEASRKQQRDLHALPEQRQVVDDEGNVDPHRKPQASVGCEAIMPGSRARLSAMRMA